MRFCISSVMTPAWHMPDRSPLISARNTGTPISEKLSAMTFMVTVLPVPVAPAMRPWRLAICGSRYRFLSDCASQILLSLYIVIPPENFTVMADKIILSQLFPAYNRKIYLFHAFSRGISGDAPKIFCQKAAQHIERRQKICYGMLILR